MLIPKVYLSKDITNDELYELIEDGLGIGEVKEIKKDLNNAEVLTEWSRFELRINGRELSTHQRWTRDKTVIVIGLVIVSLFIWLPIIFVFYKMYQERKLSKVILEKIGARISN